MIDKVQKIRKEVERLQKRAGHNFDISLTENERQFWLGESNVLTLIGKYIGTMQEEPVSEELEEMADCYKDMVTPEEVDDPEHACFYETYTEYQIADAFKAGAKWQKEKEYTCYEEAFEDGAKWKNEQMMAKAIDAKLLEGHLIRQKGVTHPLHVGDKVKVILIKED